MAALRRTLDELRFYHQRLKELLAKEVGRRPPRPEAGARRLEHTSRFGSNPGNLRMLSYVPPTLPPGAPLVVALHGCTQSAAGYDSATGWSTLADRFGFALLYPEQTRENNPNLCFNWFDPAHARRGRGEALSITEMIGHMLEGHGLDRARIGITGLSAGGAMAAVLLATYPELFAGGAIIAGLPYGCASTVQQAFESMMQGRRRPAAEWAGLVRQASTHAGPWPKISIWHGDADKTVLPLNADELVKQWTEIHAVSARPAISAELDGFPYRAWCNHQGEVLVESITVTGMGHGAPIASGLGQAAPFILDVGISSTHHIAQSWGLLAQPAGAVLDRPYMTVERPGLAVLVEQSAGPDRPRPRAAKRTPGFDPGAVIQDALRAAGLLR